MTPCVVYAGTDAQDRHRGRRPQLVGPAGRAGRADQPGGCREPEHDRLHGDRSGAVDVTGFAEHRAGDAVELLQRPAQGRVPRRRRARRRTTRAAACRSPGTPIDTSFRRSATTRSDPTAADAGRTYMYFTGDVSYPFGYGLSYTDLQVLRPARSTQARRRQRHSPRQRRRDEHQRGRRCRRSRSSTPPPPTPRGIAASDQATGGLPEGLAQGAPEQANHLDRVGAEAGVLRPDREPVRGRRRPVRAAARLLQRNQRRCAAAFITGRVRCRPTPSVVTAKPVAQGDARRRQSRSGCSSRPTLPSTPS